MTNIKNCLKTAGYFVSSLLGYALICAVATGIVLTYVVANDTRKYFKRLKGN